MLIPHGRNNRQDFLPLCGPCLRSGNCFSAVQKLLNLVQFHLSVLAVISWAIGIPFRKSLPVPVMQ
jgi:hypothetical protein